MTNITAYYHILVRIKKKRLGGCYFKRPGIRGTVTVDTNGKTSDNPDWLFGKFDGTIGMWKYCRNLWDEINADVHRNYIQVRRVCPDNNHDWEHGPDEHRFIDKINPTERRYLCHWDWTPEKIKIAVGRKGLVDN